MISAVSSATVTSYGWGPQCHGWRLVQRDALSVIEEEMPPGASETWHFHKWARQVFYVLEGELAVYASDQDGVPVRAKEGIELPPKTVHRVANAGTVPVRFLVISAPSTSDDRVQVEGGSPVFLQNEVQG